MQPLDWIKGSWVLAITLGLVVVPCATQRTTSLLKDGKLPHAPPAAASTAKEPDTSTKAKLQVTYARPPLHYFEPNQGQTDEQAHFLSSGSGYTPFLTSTEAILALHKPREEPYFPCGWLLQKHVLSTRRGYPPLWLWEEERGAFR